MSDIKEQYKKFKHIQWSIAILILLSLCVSCGGIGSNIGLGPPEHEIEKIYKPAEDMYNGLSDRKIRNSQRNWNTVIRQFDKIVKDHPKSQYADDAQYKLGLCYLRTHGVLEDSSQKAISAFKALIENYPDSKFLEGSYYLMAYAHTLAGDYDSAIEEGKEFIRKYPESELTTEAINLIEECKVKLGKSKTETTTVKDETPKPSTDETTQQIGEEVKPVKVDNEIVSEEENQDQLAETITNLEKQEATAQNPNIIDVRFHSAPESTRVVVDISYSAEYETGELKEPDRIYMDIEQAVIACNKKTIAVDDEFVEQIRVSQFDKDTVRLVLDVKPYFAYKAFCLTEPDRIVIDVTRSDVLPQIPELQDELEQSDQPESIPLVKQLGLKVKTIVIDPGHGGKDPGAVSKSGLFEKDVVLDVAKRLRALLERTGAYKIYLTRETDIYIPLKERTTFANEKGADVFISIHINAHDNLEARGIESYYLSLASDEEARMTAAMENASSGKTIKDLNNIVRYILRGAKVKESRELARTAQSQLRQHTGSIDRGIKRAPFIVLIGAESPSILVELGFISNSQDELLLRSGEYKGKLASALMQAIENYVKIIDQASLSQL